MSFANLPAEILLLILDCIDTPAILKAFCLLSKRFRAIAQPLLYRELVLPAEDIPLSLLLLCRTITTCPSIATQVRLLDIDTQFSEHILSASDAERRGLSRSDIGLLKIEAQKLRLNSIDSFESVFWATDSIILPVLLISRFPNLRELFITLNPAGLSLLTGLAQARNSIISSPSLSCLGSFDILHLGCFQDEQGGEIDISDITVLLSLLQLSKIEISDYASPLDELYSAPVDISDIPLGSLSISTISLCFSPIGAVGIGKLVESCKALDAFYCGQSDSQTVQMDPHELYSLLLCQRDSLRVLQLAFQDDTFESSAAPIFNAAQFGSLKEFASLEYLTVDQVYLGLEPDLPSSLSYLAIQNCQTPVAESLNYIASLALTGHLPSLKRVSLHSDNIHPGGMLDLPRRGATDLLFDAACRKLRGSFEGTGIKLRLESDLLASTVRGYADAFEFGQPGMFWPFIHLEQPRQLSIV
ncbi:hypothetical protein BJY04DRAFT_137857 [Aspergillus karnatakaensis]|uniref:F-box protein n=1 Tax=Aspergillus karnatakaensis TaxID=1810916 RepID=UPI003CCE42CD